MPRSHQVWREMGWDGILALSRKIAHQNGGETSHHITRVWINLVPSEEKVFHPLEVDLIWNSSSMFHQAMRMMMRSDLGTKRDRRKRTNESWGRERMMVMIFDDRFSSSFLSHSLISSTKGRFSLSPFSLHYRKKRSASSLHCVCVSHSRVLLCSLSLQHSLERFLLDAERERSSHPAVDLISRLLCHHSRFSVGFNFERGENAIPWVSVSLPLVFIFYHLVLHEPTKSVED